MRLAEPDREVAKLAISFLVQGRFERDRPVMNLVGRKFRKLAANSGMRVGVR